MKLSDPNQPPAELLALIRAAHQQQCGEQLAALAELQRLQGGLNNAVYAWKQMICIKLYRVDVRQRAERECHARTIPIFCNRK